MRDDFLPSSRPAGRLARSPVGSELHAPAAARSVSRICLPPFLPPHEFRGRSKACAQIDEHRISRQIESMCSDR